MTNEMRRLIHRETRINNREIEVENETKELFIASAVAAYTGIVNA